jgi:hypothetical protein
MSTAVSTIDTLREPPPLLSPELMEMVVQGDISALDAAGRVLYYRTLCDRLGIDPAFQPFGYLVLSGKLTLYANKACAEQLRKRHAISIGIMAREEVHDVYTVVAHAALPNGRSDESIGAVSLGNLKGDALANAIMKTETKAKRRVTLSICGLGMLDETEIETIPGARIVPTSEATTVLVEPELTPPAQPPPKKPRRAPKAKAEDDDGRRELIFPLIDEYARVAPEAAKILQDDDTRHGVYLRLYNKHRLSQLTPQEVQGLAYMIRKRITEERDKLESERS